LPIFIGLSLKWYIRIGLVFFWTVAFLLSLTDYGFLTYLYTNHLTTSILLTFVSLYFLVYPLVSGFFPKIKNSGGETMEGYTPDLKPVQAAVSAGIKIALNALHDVHNESS